MQRPDLAADATLADELIRLLANEGPLTYEQVSKALGEDPDDRDWDDHLFEVVDEVDRLVELGDERLADAVTLLSGCTLTRRLTGHEAEEEILELGGDLQPFVPLMDNSAPLARGGRATVDLARRPGHPRTERLTGPPGWLGDSGAGDLVGLRLAGGLLHVTGGAQPSAAHAGAVDAFGTAARRRLEESRFDPPRAGLAGVLWDTLADAPDAFGGVLPPLSEIARDAGLRLNETMVLPAGADADELGPMADAIHDVLVMELGGGDEEMLADLAMLRAVTRRLEAGAEVEADELVDAVEALTDPGLLDSYLREFEEHDGAGRLGAAAAPLVDGVARAAACHLQAAAAMWSDATVEAEARLREALEADPDFEPALVAAAQVAEIRGDAPAALRLLGRAGLDDTHQANRLRGYSTGGVRAGRNDPCPCGSGRKTKRCCGDRPGGALPQRAPWLLEKVYGFTDERAIELRLCDRLVAAQRLTDWAEDLDHPIVEDVALFDLGLLDDFLARWGVLLPDDERRLAERWRSTRRGLYRVERTRGDLVTLTDRRDGSTYTCRCPSPPPPRGEAILARLLPDGGDGWLLTAGALVGDEHHPAVARSLDPDADPLDVAEVCGSGRPLLFTTEGEPSVDCFWEAALHPGKEEPLRAALLRHGLTEDEPGVFFETAEVDGQPRLRGTVTLAGGQVRVETNSEPRLERLLGYVREALGEVEPIADRRRPPWRALEDKRRFGVPPVAAEPSAEERALLDEWVREQEQRWLDEPVPALSDLTPREARDHPTARRALDDLLDAFEPAQPGGFDPDRLRALLDLPRRDGR